MKNEILSWNKPLVAEYGRGMRRQDKPPLFRNVSCLEDRISHGRVSRGRVAVEIAFWRKYQQRDARTERPTDLKSRVYAT